MKALKRRVTEVFSDAENPWMVKEGQKIEVKMSSEQPSG